MWISILHNLFGFGLKFLAMFYTVNQHVAIANEYTMYLDVICFCGSLFSVCQQGGSGNACIVTPPFAQLSPSLSKNSVFLPIEKYVISIKHYTCTSPPIQTTTWQLVWHESSPEDGIHLKGCLIDLWVLRKYSCYFQKYLWWWINSCKQFIYNCKGLLHRITTDASGFVLNFSGNQVIWT